MKKIFNVFAALALLCTMVSCGGKTNPDPGPNPDPDPKVLTDVAGCWELTGVDTKVSVGSETVSVYLNFASGKFDVYQKLGSSAAHYTKLSGTYNFASGKLTGAYDNGNSLGSNYTVSFTSSTMSLATAGGKEVDTYKKISSIPESVISDVR